ncbi:MAG: hypothetical protein GYB67_07145 [Chloroflexi bacterium]|nr:hypothetical protein [Chloroflexota bacterium]
MQITTAFRNLGRNDVKVIGRDSFLIAMLAMIIIVAFLIRFLTPTVAESLMESQGFDLTPYYPLLTGYSALMLGTIIAGMIIGFIVLDERDDNTLTALMVTPLPLNWYLLYRVSIPVVLGFILIIASTLIINLVAMPLWQLVLIALSGSLVASITALFFATFADNKVAGFALVKIVSTIGFTPVISYFVPEPWQFLFGIFPPYWVIKAFWTAAEGGTLWPLYLAIGIVLMIAMLWYFVRRLNRIMHA